MTEIKFRELQLLFLTFVIFVLSIFAVQAQNKEPLPLGTNHAKEQLDDFFQTSLLKDQLYLEDKIDAGRSQGFVTRKDLEAGVIAVFRYGNKKASGGTFPESTWATQEIQRIMREKWEDRGIDPDVPDEDLTREERKLKEEGTQEARLEVGYTLGEQKRKFQKALEETKKELGRELTKEEIERIKATIVRTYPTRSDLQTDEIEGLALINNTSLYSIYDLFSNRNNYRSLLPEYFLFSHVLTPEELSARRIKTNPHEDILFGRFHMADMTVEYSDFNEGKRNLVTVTLNTPEGKVAKEMMTLTCAWTIDSRFNKDGRFVPVLDKKTGEIIGHNGKFGHKDVLIMDGYLHLEPYITKDANGFESIDESRILALYHTYLRVDPYYKDLTGITNLFREAEGRKFMEKMIALIRTH